MNNNQLNAYFSALLDYKKHTHQNRDCKADSVAVCSAHPQSDILKITKNTVVVQNDWIEAIEHGLVSTQKAIDQNRQFIQSQGEVVPLEKVKRVSRDSVEHLARHSDFITKKQEDNADLLPERLYITQKLTDFAVYENKFLYMLLRYVESFVRFRYDKICDLLHTYNGSVCLNKQATFNKRTLAIELKMSDQIKDDKQLMQNSPLKSVLRQIDGLLRVVLQQLATPLMQEVAKVAPLKPPIVKTNILKMNRDFKQAVEMYDFVTAYQKDGFCVQTDVETTSPLSDEFSEAALLFAFLTYKDGLNLDKQLQQAFKEEQKQKKQAELERQRQQLAELKRRVEFEGEQPFEYMLALEKNLQTLEQSSMELATVLNNQHAEQVAQMEAEHQNQLAIQHQTNAEALKKQQNEYQATIEQLESKISVERQQFAQQLEMSEQNAKQQCELHKAECGKLNQAIADTHAENASLAENLAFCNARLNALRFEYNLIEADEDFTDRQGFEELEHQFKIFKVFFKGEWKKTKKRIRKEVLQKPTKNKNEEK